MQMVGMEEFVIGLKESMEAHSQELRNGELFLPQYLRGRLLENAFAPVLEALARNIGLVWGRQYLNAFLPEFCSQWEVPNEKVDFAFFENGNKPFIFLEFESLNGAQLCRFSDGGIMDEQNVNKLWYYYGTLYNHYTAGQIVPRYFVLLLILPDREVAPYQLHDIGTFYRFYDPSLRPSIYRNPYLFFDRQIKACSRAFLRRENEFKINGDWKEFKEFEFQNVCELVFITCTIDRLILSRGRDLFDPQKEQPYTISWRSSSEGLL